MLRVANAGKIYHNIHVTSFEHHFKGLTHWSAMKRITNKARGNKRREGAQTTHQSKTATADFFIHGIYVNGFARLSNVFHQVLILWINVVWSILHLRKPRQNLLVALEKIHESA